VAAKRKKEKKERTERKAAVAEGPYNFGVSGLGV